MSVWIFLLIAIWPLLGLAILALINRQLAGAGRPLLPPAVHPGEILARMYLWPLVCMRLWRALSAARRQRGSGKR